MPHQIVFTAVSTYGDRLLVNLTYDEAKLPSGKAAALAGSIRHILQKEAVLTAGI